MSSLINMRPYRRTCYLCDKKNTVYHRFPRDPAIRRRWMEICDLNPEVDDVSSTVLCTDHFTKEDYSIGTNTLQQGNRVRLKKGVVPTVNVPNSEPLSVDVMPIVNIPSYNTFYVAKDHAPLDSCQDVISTPNVPSLMRSHGDTHSSSTYPKEVSSIMTEERCYEEVDIYNMKMKLKKQQFRIEQLTKKIRVLQQRNRRYFKRIISLKHGLKYEKLINSFTEEDHIELSSTSLNSTSIPPKKRKKRGPSNKWTVDDTGLVLSYMKDIISNGNELEMPSSTAFYKKLIDECELHYFDPISVRNKVRSLKAQYDKARTWLNSEGMDNDEDSIEVYIHKICPFWDILDEIYKCRTNEQQSALDETIEKETEDIEEIIIAREFDDVFVDESTQSAVECPLQFNLEGYKEENTLKKKTVIHTHEIGSDVSQSSQLELEKQKLEFQKLQWREQLKLEREKISSTEKLEIMRIEKEERVAKFEIECKIKYHSNNESFRES